MDKNYLDKVVYFKNIIELEQFLTHMQNNTSIKWCSGALPLEKDLEIVMYGTQRKTPLAICMSIHYAELSLEYGQKSAYEDMNEHERCDFEIISFRVFMSRIQAYRRF